jgi:SAM-dependent methyltransferase
VQSEYYQILASVQSRHWWYGARRTILARILAQEFDRGVPEGVIYDLGCGVGNHLETLSRFRPTIGIDPSSQAVDLCKEAGHPDVLLGHAEDVLSIAAPPAGAIVLTDVLEHIEDDRQCVKNIGLALPPNGLAIITVPAFEFLWGPSDVTNHHYRRYTKARFRKVLKDDFSIELLTYFNSFLFAPIAAGRIIERALQRSGEEGAQVPAGPVNTFLQRVMEAEWPLIRRGSLPVGISLLAVLRKRAHDAA